MSFYCLFLNKGWHYSCLNSSNTVLQVLSHSAMAEWLRPSHRTSWWCYTFPWQWQHCLFPITVHSDGMGSDHISNSDLYGPSSSFLLSLYLSLSPHPLPYSLFLPSTSKSLSLLLSSLSLCGPCHSKFKLRKYSECSVWKLMKKNNTDFFFLQQLDCKCPYAKMSSASYVCSVCVQQHLICTDGGI